MSYHGQILIDELKTNHAATRSFLDLMNDSKLKKTSPQNVKEDTFQVQLMK